MSRNFTISVDDELILKMNEYPEVIWSVIARKAFNDYINNRRKIRKK